MWGYMNEIVRAWIAGDTQTVARVLCQLTRAQMIIAISDLVLKTPVVELTDRLLALSYYVELEAAHNGYKKDS